MLTGLCSIRTEVKSFGGTMAKKKKALPMEGRIMSGVTTAAPTLWRESVHPEGKVVFFDQWCKRCGICAAFCPTKAIEEDEEGMPYLAHPDQCTLCGLCWMRCPELAIIRGPEILENKPTQDEAERTRAMLCDAGDEEACTLEEAKTPEKEVPKKEGDS